jgi:hypothetical protein
LKSDSWLARQSDGVTSNPVTSWHVLLSAIAVFNVALWSLAAVAVTRARFLMPAGASAASYVQLLLSAGYVAGCAFRSILPVYDIPRIVLVDSRWSSVLVGRSVATVAELCFAAQWALLLHRIAVVNDSGFGQAVALAIVPLIVIAEIFSWHAVLTTAQRGHVVENSVWGLSAALMGASLFMIGPHRLADSYPPMIVWCVLTIGYVAFMFLFDVPMYWSRSLADRATGRKYLSISEGAVDLWRRRVLSHRWEDWKSEIAWMSLYFTFGVWISVSLVYASISLGSHHS